MAFCIILSIAALVLQCYLHSYMTVVNASEIGASIIHLKDFRTIMVTSAERSSSTSTKLLCWENDGFFIILGKHD